ACREDNSRSCRRRNRNPQARAGFRLALADRRRARDRVQRRLTRFAAGESTKSQTSSTREIPNFNNQRRGPNCAVGDWELKFPGVWLLALGAWCFKSRQLFSAPD